jgi:hypothetical protein
MRSGAVRGSRLDRLFDRAAAKAHPRALPDAATLEAMMSERQIELGWLLAEVDSKREDAVPAEPPASASAEMIRALT